MKETAQKRYGPARRRLLFFNSCSLLIFRFRFFHDLNIKRVNMDSNLSANREHIGAVHEPFVIICHDFHLIVNTFENNINVKINELTDRVNDCYAEVEKLINGDYIETYVQALATWIDNNLQVMVSKIVKYVWFEVNEDGYFVAYIPDTWDFIDFDTEMNPDDEDYGKLALLWETAIVQ